MIDFKKIVATELLAKTSLLTEGPTNIASPAVCLFSYIKTGGTVPLSGYSEFDDSTIAKTYIPFEHKTEYETKFPGEYPSEGEMKSLCDVVNNSTYSRGGVAQYKNFKHLLPIIDLIFIVVQSNGLVGTGDFYAPNKCVKTSFSASGGDYRRWFDQLKTTPANSYTIDWSPISSRGKDVARAISDDVLREFAAKLALNNFAKQSILYAITNLLAARHQMRIRTTVKKNAPASSLHPDVLKLLEQPESFSAGTQKLPAKVNNMYDSGNSGNIATFLWELGLIIKQFFEIEIALYFPGEDPSECITSVKDVLLNNNIEAGGSNVFYFKKIDGTQVPADKIGEGGYILENIKKYKENSRSEALYEKLTELASYIQQGIWNWKAIIGGAKGAVSAISSIGGKFGT